MDAAQSVLVSPVKRKHDAVDSLSVATACPSTDDAESLMRHLGQLQKSLTWDEESAQEEGLCEVAPWLLISDVESVKPERLRECMRTVTRTQD